MGELADTRQSLICILKKLFRGKTNPPGVASLYLEIA
jgi:hypothetical protein